MAALAAYNWKETKKINRAVAEQTIRYGADSCLCCRGTLCRQLWSIAQSAAVNFVRLPSWLRCWRPDTVREELFTACLLNRVAICAALLSFRSRFTGVRTVNKCSTMAETISSRCHSVNWLYPRSLKHTGINHTQIAHVHYRWYNKMQLQK